MKLCWLTLAAKEWRRRPVRTAVTVTGVALALGVLFALLAFERGYRQALRDEVDRLGAHVLVVPKGCPYDAASLALHGANWPCYLNADHLDEIRALPGVQAAVPALMHALPDAAGRATVYVGTDASLLVLRPHWVLRGRFPERAGEILVGGELARRHGWRVGDRVELPGCRGEHGTVSGVVEPTHGADDYFIHLPLAEAQRLFGRPRQLTHVLVRLRDPARWEETLQQFRGCDAGMNLNVVPLAHLFRTIRDLVNSTRWLLGCVAVVALLVAGAGVSNTLLLAVTERTREIGVFRAVGASPRDVFRLVLLEAVLICLAGGGLGLVLALAGSEALETWLRTRLPFTPDGSLLARDGRSVLWILVGAMALGGAAAWLPAWRACQISPRVAMQGPGGGE